MKFNTINQTKRKFNINHKTMNIPSFFMISNLGGGGSDKYRETVYLDLLKNTPTLYNYHYLRDPKFANKWISKINNFNTFGEFINFTRKSMIDDEHFYCDDYTFEYYNCKNTIYLLDSGAANIINNLLKTININNNPSQLNNQLINIMKEYYTFANRFKFDIVIGFDIGGKYTSKGEERTNESIIAGNQQVKEKSNTINNILIEESIKYIKSHPEFYPSIYATVHGSTAKEYLKNIRYILNLEEKYDFKFDGFALGGIASSKSLDKSKWNIDESSQKIIKALTKGIGSKDEVYNSIISSFACRIVKSAVGDRPIHALGAGGKINILPLYFSGATSFDSQTPGRRAYDGNTKSTEQVFDSTAKNSFSQYLIGLLNKDLDLINTSNFNSYIKLNLLDETIESCGCPSCDLFSISDIKTLYSKKNNNNEYYYLSRQLLNAHGIWQHNYICNLATNSTTSDIISKLSNNKTIANILKYIIFDFNYEIEE